ncbi:MAG TPA: pseudouridine synthase [Caulobacteraceae bacterium]|jgi:23S rRNA pseudouridine2605 synthase
MAHEDEASAPAAPGQAAENGDDAGGERIAKVLARAGVASRREVERLIAAGRVALNGQTLTTPAVKVSASDRVTLDGRPVRAAEPTRLFRYHKPPGLVTTHSDPQGRPTVFEALPKGLPRLISVGRLDLNSEGLLLLTNDGELARRLALPSSGLLRRYRARARGHVDPARLARLKDGITVDGVRYGPIEAALEPGHEGGANSWLVLSLAEGKNREVRKVLEAIGLTVNRLIRVAYGPYELGTLGRGEAQELPSPSSGGVGGGGKPAGQGAVSSKPLKPRRSQSPPPPTPPLKGEGKKKPGWAKAKPKPKPARSGPAAGRRAGPRGPTPSASPRRSSGARPPGPRTGGGPKRRG